MSGSVHDSRSDPQRGGGEGRVPAQLDDWLLERALFGLSEQDQDELDAAFANGALDVRSTDESEYELAAAAVALALTDGVCEPMSGSLRDKVLAGAKAFHARGATASSRSTAVSPVADVSSADSLTGRAATLERPDGQRSTRFTEKQRSTGALAWFVAAAAAVLALIGWWPKRAPSVPTSFEARAELLARPDTLRVDAKGQEAFAPGATGDVVWSNDAQAGFIRLVGAPANDSKVQQYQLWIFDAEQENPIDGGVFDVAAGGEVLIPIDAKLHVAKPTLFAITLEKPGGVVVSDRQRIAIVAAL